jgi:predicted CXXCH cytochrome family protein
MNSLTRSIIAATLLAGLGAAPASRPTVAVDPANCVSSDCHPGIKSSKATHGPVAASTCDACHEVVDVAAHTYRLKRDGADLCTYCHEFDVSAMPVIHKPARTGECLGCHDPHGGRDRTLTREASMQQLCGRCHQSLTQGHEFLHTPVKAGQCDSCHPPHAAMFPKLLDAVGTDLCLACHQDFERQLAEVSTVHKALDKGCAECHDVHASDQPMQLNRPTLELCLGCHEKTGSQLVSAKYTHSAATRDRACLTCHTAHGSDIVKLMLDQPIALCMSCHRNEIRVDAKRVIPAVKELADNGMHKHGAVKDGQCSGCHGAHGTDQPLLLTKVYSRTLYKPFDVANYQLCFSCHDVGLVKQKTTATLTAFRNGDRNLHWIHIRQDERGRSCYMCHTTHASANDRNVRATTPYKLWNMPIGFTKTATGGSCTPGCHVSWSYDRITPAPGPTSMPSHVPPSAVARAEGDQPVMISLTAPDECGQAITVPDSTRPAVLLLLSAEQMRDEAIVKAFATSIPDDVPIQVVVVECGPGDNAPVALRWPIVPDPDRRISADLDVHGWPTALVLQSDGLQVARIGGSPESFAQKLSPYLQLADKTLDRAAVERQLSQHTVVGDGATRDLLTAQRLISDGKSKQAMKVLAEAIERHPDSIPLRIAIARALIALDRHGEAQGVLKVVLDHSPHSSDAHYLMGVIHEHAGDWQAAAQAYRAAGPR